MSRSEKLTVYKFEKIAATSLLIRCLVSESQLKETLVDIYLYACCKHPSTDNQVFQEIIYHDELPRKDYKSALGLKKRYVLPYSPQERYPIIQKILLGWEEEFPRFLSTKPVVACKKPFIDGVFEISPSGLLLIQCYRDLSTRLAYGINGGNWTIGIFERLEAFIKQRQAEWDKILNPMFTH